MGRPSTPLLRFLDVGTGGAAIMVAATLAAIVWANLDHDSYAAVWDTQLSIQLGGVGVAMNLRDWINSGLMTLFFFAVGLEARREFDVGELRERRRFALPLFAGIGGMLAPIAIYLAFNAGESSASAWGVVMSTDTAFLLGVLTLVRPGYPVRLRAFMVTLTIADDFAGLTVLTTVYSRQFRLLPFLLALAIFGLVLLVRRASVRYGPVYLLLGAMTWLAMLHSGLDPIVVGLAMGLLPTAYPIGREVLERVSEVFRTFREQPTGELARYVRTGLAHAIPPNERLHSLYTPWTSYLIVPLFALANTGIAINGAELARAYTSPVTLGVFAGYVLGKPLGIFTFAALTSRLSRGRLRLPVGWAALAGGGAAAGLGFTVALLIATLALSGTALDQAKIGILSAATCAPLVSLAVFRITARLAPGPRVRALLGPAEVPVDLAVDVDPDRDHIRGPVDAPVTLVEYGDFECPYCGLAEPAVRELLGSFHDVRYVWRHLPLRDVHPNAQLAAEAAEAAAAQGAFWPMHDLLLTRQQDLRIENLIGYAEQLGLDVDRFRDHLSTGASAVRVAEDVDSADLSGVSGTPTFFINGHRHYGAYDITTLASAVRAAKDRALHRRSTRPPRRR